MVSDACKENCSANVPLYPQSTLQLANQQVELLYGDSHTGTRAVGPIGKDTAGIAGLVIQDQYLAAIVETNTTVLETGSAGILGFGFPAIRCVTIILCFEITKGLGCVTFDMFALYESYRGR